jgi:septal ring factor EnvC (AmiA/AmiB activator)
MLTAKQAELYLQTWSRSEERDGGVTAEEELRAEVSGLEAELQEKTALLAHYAQVMEDWTQRYHLLEDDNERVQDELYDLHGAAQPTGK